MKTKQWCEHDSHNLEFAQVGWGHLGAVTGLVFLPIPFSLESIKVGKGGVGESIPQILSQTCTCIVVFLQIDRSALRALSILLMQ